MFSYKNDGRLRHVLLHFWSPWMLSRIPSHLILIGRERMLVWYHIVCSPRLAPSFAPVGCYISIMCENCYTHLSAFTEIDYTWWNVRIRIPHPSFISGDPYFPHYSVFDNTEWCGKYGSPRGRCDACWCCCCVGARLAKLRDKLATWSEYLVSDSVLSGRCGVLCFLACRHYVDDTEFRNTWSNGNSSYRALYY